MRCYQVRQRLTSLGSLQVDDRELQNHLRSCPDCARLADAASALNRDLRTAGAHDTHSGLSFAELRYEVERRASLASQPSSRESTLMSILTNPIRRNPKLGVGLAVAAVVLIFATVVPFSYDRTIGYEVAFGSVDPTLALDDARINELLGKLGVEDAVVDVTDCDERCNLRISRLNSPTEAHLVRAAFAGWKAVETEGDIKPVNVSCTGSLIKLAADGPRIIRVNLTTSSDDDIDRMVAERLGTDFDCNVFFNGDSSSCSLAVDLDLVAADGADGNFFVGSDQDSVICKTVLIGGDSAGLGALCQGIDTSCLGFGSDSNHCTMVLIGSADEGKATCSLPGIGEVDFKSLTDEDIQRLRDQGFEVEITKGADGDITKIILKKGNTTFNGPEPGQVPNQDLDAAKPAQLPEGYELAQNYPNPFNPTTSISFTLPETAPVRLEIFNTNGRLVRTLVNTTLGTGTHVYQWDATSDNGARVASGVYLYRLSAGDVVTTRKMTLLK
jgi:hypothetical protein